MITVLYKSTYLLTYLCAMQVWSQGSGPANATSADIIMKSQSWLEAGDKGKIVLVNAEEKVSGKHSMEVVLVYDSIRFSFAILSISQEIG